MKTISDEIKSQVEAIGITAKIFPNRKNSLDQTPPSKTHSLFGKSTAPEPQPENALRQKIVDKLYENINPPDRVRIEYQNETYITVTSSELKMYLFRLFGSQLDIEVIDRNILTLIDKGKGWLEQKENSSFKLDSKSAVAELDKIMGLIIGSLSQNIIGIVRQLISNISSILSSEDLYSEDNKVDVNIHERCSDGTLLVIHTRFAAETKSKNAMMCFFGGSKKNIVINYNLRKIGINRKYVHEIDPLFQTIFDEQQAKRNQVVKQAS